MPYPAINDRRIPYDNDGTLIYRGSLTDGAQTEVTQAQAINLQKYDRVSSLPVTESGYIYWFFPEQREISAAFFSGGGPGGIGQANNPTFGSIEGSNDTTNGSDGTWELATMPGGTPISTPSSDTTNPGAVPFDKWRSAIKPVSFTGPKKNVRFKYFSGSVFFQAHWYGEAAGGAMAHDLVFLDHDDTPGVEYTAVEDFGDQPLGTTVIRQFRLRNTSASKTATNVNIQCNDTDFTIGASPSGPWVATINLASLAPGAESPTYYLRCTTPPPGAALIPRCARVVAVTDAGFFG